MDPRPGQDLHLGALAMAIAQRRPARGLIHHMDRGSQYRTAAYQAMLTTHVKLTSVNGRKVPHDKALAERIFSTLKKELVHHQDFIT